MLFQFYVLTCVKKKNTSIGGDRKYRNLVEFAEQLL